MLITFRNKKLKKQLNERKELNKLGPQRSKLVQRRLTEIEAVPNLSILKMIPGPRLHPLKGNRHGEFSVDVDHPYRLIFIPDHDPVPVLPSGVLDWKSITQVKILEIADTHE